MRTIPSTVALIFLVSLPVLAQETSPYRIDNFDFANGVRVELPPATAPQRGKRGVRKLTRTTSLSYPQPPAELTHTTVSNSLEGFTTGNADVDSYIVESGQRNSVDPLLLYSIMHQESSFKRNALSYKGASGLMQLMPPTARRFGVKSIFDPRQNIEGGARYMRWLLDYFDGDVKLALAGYNAGEGAVIKYGYRVPPYAETQEYVRRIGRRYSLIRDPLTAQYAHGISRDQVGQTESKPLTTYERTVSAIRLPDGRLQLVSQ